MSIKSVKMEIANKKQTLFFLMFKDHSIKKLGSGPRSKGVFRSLRIDRHTQTLIKVDTEFFLHPIIKDQPNI